jgi:proteasome lid subunit RPN8/RPN11
MILHAREDLPMEAVGILGGINGRVQRRIPLPNILGAKHFLADPYAQFQALHQLYNDGLTPLAVYHSHPGGGVLLSAEDLLFASQLPYLQLVIALDRTHNPTIEVAAYLVTSTTMKEVSLVVLD